MVISPSYDLAEVIKLVTRSRPVYYSILNSFDQRSQHISIKFPLHKQSEKPWICFLPRQYTTYSRLYNIQRCLSTGSQLFHHCWFWSNHSDLRCNPTYELDFFPLDRERSCQFSVWLIQGVNSMITFFQTK